MTNRASASLLHGFWPAARPARGRPIAQCNSAITWPWWGAIHSSVVNSRARIPKSARFLTGLDSRVCRFRHWPTSDSRGRRATLALPSADGSTSGRCPLVGLLPALMPRSPVGSREVRVESGGRSRPRWLNKSWSRPGDVTWRLVKNAHGGELLPAACHWSASVLRPVSRAWWYAIRLSPTISPVAARIVWTPRRRITAHRVIQEEQALGSGYYVDLLREMATDRAAMAQRIRIQNAAT
jgi:hypothetical protein